MNLLMKFTDFVNAARGYFGRLIFQYSSFNNVRSLHLFLAALASNQTSLPLGSAMFGLHLAGLRARVGVVVGQKRRKRKRI